MSVFLIAFSLLYSLLHAYAFVKARAAFAFGPAAAAGLILVMFFMAASLFLSRFTEFAGHDSLARLLGFVAYIWMGLVFLFLCSGLLVDLVHLVSFVLGKVFGSELLRFAPAAKASFLISLILTVTIAAYGSYEARHVRLREVVIRTSKALPNHGVVRIAHISDVHLGLLLRQERLKRILDKVMKASPDMIVSTGDLVDGQMDSLNGLDKLLEDIRPRYGKFAVTGNHEFYAGIEHSIDFTRRSGFQVLRGEATTVAGGLAVAGVDDPAGPGHRQGRTDADKRLLSKIPREHFILFLKHRPAVGEGAAGLFDLQLSGHVHGGQIFPFGLIVRLFHPFLSGYFPLDQGSSLYVSRGSGTWGPPIRFLAPPEVAIITLIHDDSARNRELGK